MSLADQDKFEVFDQLPFQIAVLNDKGQIEFTNSEWDEFSRLNGYEGPDYKGMNYLSICSSVEGVEKYQANAVSIGIKRVVEREIASFEEVYPCHSPTQKRWFKLFATKTEFGTIVSHVDLSNEGNSGLPIGNREKLSGIIHDLKTPLTIILGFSKLLDVEFKKNKVVDDLELYIKKINNSASNMLENVNELLEVSAGKKTNEQQNIPIDVNTTTKEILESFSTLLKEKNITISETLKEEIKFLSPKGYFKNILINMVSNAIKYNKDDGNIFIQINKNKSKGMEILVEDTGIGIEKDELNNIFNPFHRVDELTDAIEGSGIGLSNVYRMVEEMEGKIKVDSQVGKGTKFEIIFPSWRTV